MLWMVGYTYGLPVREERERLAMDTVFGSTNTFSFKVRLSAYSCQVPIVSGPEREESLSSVDGHRMIKRENNTMYLRYAIFIVYF